MSLNVCIAVLHICRYSSPPIDICCMLDMFYVEMSSIVGTSIIFLRQVPFVAAFERLRFRHLLKSLVKTYYDYLNVHLFKYYLHITTGEWAHVSSVMCCCFFVIVSVLRPEV